MEPCLKKNVAKKVFKGGAEKKRLKNELQLKIAAKSCQKISNIFATNQSKPVKVNILPKKLSIYRQ